MLPLLYPPAVSWIDIAIACVRVRRIREHPCLEHSANSIDPKTRRLSDRQAAAMNDIYEVVVTVIDFALDRLAGEALLGLEVLELGIRCLYRVSSQSNKVTLSIISNDLWGTCPSTRLRCGAGTAETNRNKDQNDDPDHDVLSLQHRRTVSPICLGAGEKRARSLPCSWWGSDSSTHSGGSWHSRISHYCLPRIVETDRG